MRGFLPRWLALTVSLGVPIAVIALVSVRAIGWTTWPSSHPLVVAGAVVVGLGFLYMVAQEFGPKTFRIAMVLVLLLAIADLAATGASAPPEASASEKIVDTVTSSRSDETERETTDADGGTTTTIIESTTTTTVDSTTIEPINPPEEPSEPPADSLLGNIDAGGEARARQLLPDAFSGLRLGTVGWLVIAMCVAFIWRRLETVNARRVATPVVVEKFIVPGDYTDADRLTAQFENGLAHAGILEPASVPGGEVTSELIEVFDGESGPATWFTPVLRLLKLAVPRRGTVVIPTLETVTPPCISVRVVTARQRRTLYAKTISEPTLKATVERAAAYVSQLTHSYNTTTPKWARWQSVDAEGFDLFVDVHVGRTLPEELVEFDRLTSLLRDDTKKKREYHKRPKPPVWVRQQPEPGGAIPVQEAPTPDQGKKVIELSELAASGSAERRRLALRQALRNSPSNGIVRVELGHAYELRGTPGDRWKALRLYLEAAYDHPRLLVAQYRVATTLSLIVGDIQNTRLAPPAPTDIRSIARLAPEVIGCNGTLSSNPFDGIAGVERHGSDKEAEERFAIDCASYAEPLIDLASTALKKAKALLKWRLAWHALRHLDERQYWIDLGRNTKRRQHLRAQIAVVDCILQLRKERKGATIPQLQSKVEKQRKKCPGAGVLYNVACFHAIAARESIDSSSQNQHRADAVGQLLWARRAAGTGFPSAAWLELDPDLEDLRDGKSAEFDEVLSWVKSSPYGLPSFRTMRKLDKERTTTAERDPNEALLTPTSIEDWETIARGRVYEALGEAIEEGKVTIDLTAP